MIDGQIHISSFENPPWEVILQPSLGTRLKEKKRGRGNENSTELDSKKLADNDNNN
jgi:hypothetical protein